MKESVLVSVTILKKPRQATGASMGGGVGGGGVVGGATVEMGIGVELQLVLSRMIVCRGMISTRLKRGSVTKACVSEICVCV